MINQGQKTFKDIQAEYDQLFRQEPIRDEDRGYRWLAKRLLHEQPRLKCLLDLACGGGYFLREIRNLVTTSSLYGADISKEALELAYHECPEAQVALGVGEKLPFKNNSFDAISCLGSLEHFLDIPKAIEEMKRVATKDGLFFILVPNLFWYKDLISVFFTGYRKERNQTQERFESMGDWCDLLERSGLRIKKTHKYNGISRWPLKQILKNLLIPLRFSYHFLFICQQK